MSKEINSLIANYANIYASFEKLQKTGKLSTGDQKTGVIAEYYAKCYIDTTFNVNAEYAKPGECYDVSYTYKGKHIRVQVKGVSAHSKTRIIAPLNIELDNGKASFDHLYLISLDEDFKPDGFYINTYEEIKKKMKDKNDNRKKIQGASMQGKNKKGYWLFDFSKNISNEMNKAIKEHN